MTLPRPHLLISATVTLAVLGWWALAPRPGSAPEPETRWRPGMHSIPELLHQVPGHADPRRARARGLAFLVAHQNPDGSWGSFESARPDEIWLGTVASHRAFRVATSALAVMALVRPASAAGAPAAALRKGLDYLLSEEPPLRATGEVLYDNWAHLYLAQALASCYAEPGLADRRSAMAVVAQRELARLARLQGADGGWGYYDFDYAVSRPTGLQSTSFMTAAVLVALYDADRARFPVDPAMIQRGLRALARLRVENGSYVYGTGHRLYPAYMPNRVKGSLARSQPCNLALWLHGRSLDRADLLGGVRTMFAEHSFLDMGRTRPRPHEAWYMNSGYYFYFGHYYAARIIRELELDDRGQLASVMADTLARLQNPDGAWWDFPMYNYHKAYGTALALLTLQECGVGP